MAKGLQRAFAAEVRARRKELGISQEEFAARADLHMSYVGMIERCERVPTLLAIDKIARAFKTRASELIAGAEERG